MSHAARHFDVVVLGGGNAGMSAAARLLRSGVHDVAVVEPQDVHTYRPLLSYVGGGQVRLRTAERTQRSVTPRGCTWIRDRVVGVATDGRHLIAGEFDRSGALASSLPSFVDSTKPRRSAWVFDRYVLPQMYWHQILKGRL